MESIFVHIKDEPGCYRFDYNTHEFKTGTDGQHDYLRVYEEKDDLQITKLLVPIENLLFIRCE